jgi:hypothetical protein
MTDALENAVGKSVACFGWDAMLALKRNAQKSKHHLSRKPPKNPAPPILSPRQQISTCSQKKSS